MTEANSRSITTNQQGLHEKLDEIVTKHLTAEFKKPIAAHTQSAFDEVNARVQAFNGPIILDSCCGVGESTANLAKRHPDALVIGIDKSAHRLDKHDVEYKQTEQGQYILVQADLNDFWRLALEADWQPTHHYLLYPNPWPKAKHIQRRWHGSAVFPFIVKLGGKLELRSNWDIYVKEFARALALSGVDVAVEAYESDEAITPFERKYWASGQSSTRLVVTL
ncbi:SAM-dependent methyltransferase [Pseudoalteromonas sp. CO348]|uniref:tRNA (guanine(46)-N(7))-methyltransferase n=1 Tax=Pseudoalteromonas maricaloris TaxID=184924 RepID=A0A8I2KRU0_9GAMM|nr:MULTISPECIES: methyltransferase domain-containing protein [Pseudoalteromonas]MCG7538884.1 SAM-dependent methyltransferase [Pseudoalteromonas sp. OF7H-1]MCG9770585.1 SAM-dependent methyltransferase [Pseudoalteromonas piscicida]NLR23378.1 SAM-dependent methyltransferase [Pseudoalteromonas maricaloris]RZG03126.1 SAM-dependent methyltransferase [Pseudoalteromonas sp. CO348]WOX29242.1 SAM-dependent methyltransferase [Pseudoalteromonas maricaloris]